MLRAARDQIWRICRIAGGIVLLLVGLFLSLPGVPGPGIVLLFVSFGILSRDFKWAERWHLRLKDMAQKIINRRKTAKQSHEEQSHGAPERQTSGQSSRTRGQP